MNWKNKLNTFKEFSFFLLKRTKEDAVTRVASSLSYTSLIALVPLFAVALAIFSAFPVFSGVKDQVQTFLLSSVAPNMEGDLSQYFNDFVNATAKLTTIGVIGISVTSILLLSTIENSFNFIFKVNRPRSFATKITLYWTVITLGPLLLGTAFSLRGYLFTIQKIMPESINDTAMYLSKVIPPIITVIVLMLVYILVPNKKVRFKPAFIGATIALILFGVLRIGFSSFVLNGGTYKTLYGAMAAVPIMLVWMYLSWAVVILGAVITASIEEFRQKSEDNLLKMNNKKIKRKLYKKPLDIRTNFEQTKEQIKNKI